MAGPVSLGYYQKSRFGTGRQELEISLTSKKGSNKNHRIRKIDE
jgi:hypothetical protein